jgi:hypothetical protein
MPQITQNLIMIRPVSFAFNEQTASTNTFQSTDRGRQDVQQRALREFNQMAARLRDEGLNVFIADDTDEPHTPDSIFPNNWFSTHEDGTVVLYPMQAENRRYERRPDIFDALSDQYQLLEMIDLTAYEKENKFLEGTGSLVLDRDLRIAYAALSPRTDAEVAKLFANKMGYELLLFTATDKKGIPVYHTNVIMCVADEFLVVCMESIHNPDQRKAIVQSTSKEIITITASQMELFAGNMLQVKNAANERLLLMSKTAYDSLTPEQITRLEKYNRIMYFDISTIEQHGGGRVRCMLAENFLPVNPNR